MTEALKVRLMDLFIHFAIVSLKIFAVQHVDVCMFSNGKFKNIVAEVDVSKQIGPSESLHGVYSLLPIRGLLKPLFNKLQTIGFVID